MQSQVYWGCVTKFAAFGLPHIAWNIEGTSLRLSLWDYFNYWWNFRDREFPLSWFLNLLILVPQASLLCLWLFMTLMSWINQLERFQAKLKFKVGSSVIKLHFHFFAERYPLQTNIRGYWTLIEFWMKIWRKKARRILTSSLLIILHKIWTHAHKIIMTKWL